MCAVAWAPGAGGGSVRGSEVTVTGARGGATGAGGCSWCLRSDSAKSLDIQRELNAWDALPSVPAVKNHRVHLLVGDELVVSGPRVVETTRTLAQTLHPR